MADHCATLSGAMSAEPVTPIDVANTPRRPDPVGGGAGAIAIVAPAGSR